MRKNDKTNIEESKPQFGNVKDELFLISFIILCAGLVYADSYYQRFGFKYQLLDLPTFYLIYKGLVMIFNSPYMIIPYLLTVCIIIIEFIAIKKRYYLFLMMRTPIVYAFLIINLFIVFPLSKNAGMNQAMVDIYANTSGLPKIRTLVSNNFKINYPEDNYLLFMIDGGFVTVFVPLEKNEKNAYPIIKRISKNEVSLLETTM